MKRAMKGADMPANLTTFESWRKSSRSGGNGGNCVEVGFSTTADVTGIRDTKDRSYGTLAINGTAWAAFLDNVKDGALDR